MDDANPSQSAPPRLLLPSWLSLSPHGSQQHLPPHVLLSCLAKDPDQRPRSAQALAEQLRGCAIPAWTQAEARAWSTQHPTATKPAVDPYATTLPPRKRP